MGGRHAKAVALHISQGNPNRLTKAEIARRKEAEIKLGKTDLEKLKPPTYIENDIVALRYWKQHLHEYKEAAKSGIEVLSSSDVGLLALYCKTFGEYESLLKLKQGKEDATIDTLIKLETLINKKMDMLIKMQDRLFLNPLSKCKNVPKKEADKPKNPMEDEFDI